MAYSDEANIALGDLSFMINATIASNVPIVSLIFKLKIGGAVAEWAKALQVREKINKN